MRIMIIGIGVEVVVVAVIIIGKEVQLLIKKGRNGAFQKEEEVQFQEVGQDFIIQEYGTTLGMKEAATALMTPLLAKIHQRKTKTNIQQEVKWIKIKSKPQARVNLTFPQLFEKRKKLKK